MRQHRLPAPFFFVLHETVVRRESVPRSVQKSRGVRRVGEARNTNFGFGDTSGKKSITAAGGSCRNAGNVFRAPEWSRAAIGKGGRQRLGRRQWDHRRPSPQESAVAVAKGLKREDAAHIARMRRQRQAVLDGWSQRQRNIWRADRCMPSLSA